MHKLIFFDILINLKNKIGAEAYMNTNLKNILLELNKNEWKSKEKYFIQIIKNSESLNWKKILNANYKRFLNLIKKYFDPQINEVPEIINHNDNNEINISRGIFNFIIFRKSNFQKKFSFEYGFEWK